MVLFLHVVYFHNQGVTVMVDGFHTVSIHADRVVCFPVFRGRRNLGRPFFDDMKGFKEICKPIISYLKNHCDPYTEVHNSIDGIKVTSV